MITRPPRVGSFAPGREYFEAGSSRLTSPLRTMSASNIPVRPLVIDPISKIESASIATFPASGLHANAVRTSSPTVPSATHAGDSD